MLLLDKYRPKVLEDLDYHTDLTQALINVSSTNNFPHILFYGPSGGGKKTRVMALLHRLYGPGVLNLSLSRQSVTTNPQDNSSIDVTLVTSPCHIDMTPSDCGLQDRAVIQELLKEIAQNQHLAVGPARADARTFKTVVLNAIDQVSMPAQQALRRTMEKYMVNCRLIMTATNITGVIEAIRSRCLCFRVSAPTTATIDKLLRATAAKEGITLQPEVSAGLAAASRRNLRRALLMLDVALVKTAAAGPTTQDLAEATSTEWEGAIAHIAQKINEAQSPEQMFKLRDNLNDLLTHCIPASLIIKRLLYLLLGSCAEHEVALKRAAIKDAAKYEHRLHAANMPILHLEAFVASFMHQRKEANMAAHLRAAA